MSDLKLRPASSLDIKVLFDLRNHPKVRKHSNNIGEISIDTHQKWFNKVILDKSKQILIAERGGIFIGMVRFERVDGAYLMSWAVSPEFQAQGLGKKIVGAAVNMMGKNIFTAKIKKNNFSSIKIAEYIGMELTKETNGILLYQK